MGRVSRYVTHVWTTDIALSTLLISLLTYVFILHPLVRNGSLRFIAIVFFSLILISGAIATRRNRLFRTFVLVWSILTFIFVWGAYLFPSPAFAFADFCLSLVFLVLLTLLILEQVFREGPTTSHRIMGAVAAYLLLGLAWSLIYYMIALWIPGAFSGLEIFMQGDKEALRTHFQYFSFSVLTSVGFGDIVPIDPSARMAVVLEGVVGQLFPAILIARLVSLHVQSGSRRKIHGEHN